MAAALNYGHMQSDHSSMHPFFQTLASRQQHSPPRQSTPYINVGATLDGAGGEKAPDTPYTAESGKAFQDGRVLDLEPDVQHPAALNVERSVGENVHEAEIDLNYERRKRRKTSPLLTSSQDGVFRASDSGPSPPNQASWQAQEETAEDLTAVQLNPTVTQVTPSSVSSAGNSIYSGARSSSQSMKVNTSADREYASEDLVPNTPVQAFNASVSRKGSLRSPRSTPPKKKMIKLSANGKLLSSPKQPDPMAKPASESASSIRLNRGRLTSSLQLALSYGHDDASRSRIGAEIDVILQRTQDVKLKARLKPEKDSKTTHPFFLGKVRSTKVPALETTSSNVSARGQDSERDGSVSPQPRKALAWKDLVFTNKKAAHLKVGEALPPLWPPNKLQQLGRDSTYSLVSTFSVQRPQKSKSKQQDLEVDVFENNIASFAAELSHQIATIPSWLMAPEMKVMSGCQVLKMQTQNELSRTTSLEKMAMDFHPAIGTVRSSLVNYLSPFDMGRLDSAQDWPTKYAPMTTSAVLPQGCEVLRDWLRSLSIHQVNVNSNATKRGKLTSNQGRKKRRRKRAEDLDDFIASSDEESCGGSGVTKNAILLKGPSGCGKTASVFAVANELDFEVFEIHPGMRRTAKDIFDKVGDMTQNHLVQQVAALDSRTTSSGAAPLSVSDNSGTHGAVKSALNTLFGPKDKVDGKEKIVTAAPSQNVDMAAKPSKPQKESLVLFEEVDILFEEDRSFWSGVIALIEQSKRPVILTCNDARDVPLADLSLHTTLTLEPPPPEIVVEYLLSIAAKEGHLLRRDAILDLYNSKGRDLRAALSELNFWCQMTLGSQQGGLDWMLDRRKLEPAIDGKADKLRVFSKDTFTRGLDIFPYPRPVSGSRQHEEILKYARDELDIPVSYWQEDELGLPMEQGFYDLQPVPDCLSLLRRVEAVTDSKSALDLMHENWSPKMSGACSTLLSPGKGPPGREDIVNANLALRRRSQLDRDDLLAAFEPIMTENSILSLGSGRLAPSFDGSTSTIATDLAPYIRSIVGFDQRLEQHREELGGGSQGKKTRTTRAARAALEGGNKAYTRRERWFPACTNFDSVLQTGGDWPNWYAVSESASSQSIRSSPGSESDC